MPCTPLQEAMLSASSAAPASYLNKTAFKIKGDLRLLRQAMAHMIRRHEILRTCFATTKQKDYAFAQIVLSTAELPWTCVTSGQDGVADLNRYDDHQQSPLLDSGNLGYEIFEVHSQAPSSGMNRCIDANQGC